MRAMLLAAGLGVRMLPLSLSVPKPGLPVLGRPLAVQIAGRLARHGVGRLVLNLHHLPDAVRRLFPEGSGGMPEVAYTDEPTILGTGGGLRNAASLLRGDGPILVHNCDFLSDIDVEAVMERHRSTGAAATMVLTRARAGYSVVDVDSEGRVISIAGQPAVEPRGAAGSYLFTGMHVLDEGLLDLLPAEGPSHLVPDLFRPLSAEGRLGSYVHDGFWWEFGSPELLLEGCLHLIDLGPERQGEIGEADPVRRIGQARAACGGGVELADDVRVGGRVAFGLAVRVGERSVIEDSIVMPGSWIGPRSRLSRVVVGPGAELPAGFEAENALVCADPAPEAPLPAATHREGGLLIRPLDEGGS